MSAEALGYVWTHSPYSGAALLCHLAIADTVSDMHDNLFWASARSLATKARIARETAARTLTTLERDGYVERVGDTSGAAVTFRFLFPSDGGGVTSDHRGVTSDHMGVESEVTGGVTPRHTLTQVTQTRTQENPKNIRAVDLSSQEVNDFDEFWSEYPKAGRRSKPRARLKFKLAIRRAAARDIIAAAARYRDDPNRDDAYTKHAATWLHNDCWQDELLPSRSPPDRAAQLLVEAMKEGYGGPNASEGYPGDDDGVLPDAPALPRDGERLDGGARSAAARVRPAGDQGAGASGDALRAPVPHQRAGPAD